MYGHSHPFGLVISDGKDWIIAEDIFSLLRFFIILFVMTKLLTLIQTAVFIIILSVIILVYCSLVCYYEASQWHATEHKLIYLLEHSCPLTIENFQKTSIKHERCGINNKILLEPSKKKIKIAIKAGEEYLESRIISRT
ncbi:MAG: DUF1385 domain-containing protein [Candidatus Pacebacteria bacterium]|nr:DUF1385 domain-containing protein [Candidatus Paceibacterota bacterium]